MTYPKKSTTKNTYNLTSYDDDDDDDDDDDGDDDDDHYYSNMSA